MSDHLPKWIKLDLSRYGQQRELAPPAEDGGTEPANSSTHFGEESQDSSKVDMTEEPSNAVALHDTNPPSTPELTPAELLIQALLAAEWDYHTEDWWDDPDSGIADQEAAALKTLDDLVEGGSAPVDGLVENLHTDEGNIHRGIVVALARLGTKAEPAAPRLLEILQKALSQLKDGQEFEEEHFVDLSYVVRALAAVAPADEAATGAYKDLMLCSQEDAECVNRAAIEAIATMGRDAIPLFVHVLTSADQDVLDDVRQDLVSALVELSQEVDEEKARLPDDQLEAVTSQLEDASKRLVELYTKIYVIQDYDLNEIRAAIESLRDERGRRNRARN
jgi:hypothetical protein